MLRFPCFLRWVFLRPPPAFGAKALTAATAACTKPASASSSVDAGILSTPVAVGTAVLYLVSNALNASRFAFVTVALTAASIAAMIASTSAFEAAFAFGDAGTDATGAAADAFAFVDTRRVTGFAGFLLFVQVMTLSFFFAGAAGSADISLYYLPPKETRTGFL